MLTNEAKFKADPPAGFDGQFKWEYLIPAFKRATGRNIRPMDIDMHVEIRGNHLIFETKDKGVPVPEPQRFALLQLWAKCSHMVIFLWGKTEPIECEIYYQDGRKKGRAPVTVDELVAVVEEWGIWAEKHPFPLQYDARIAAKGTAA